MISKNTEYLPRLDHLRFLAAALVAAYHFGYHAIQPGGHNPLLMMIKEGYGGVSLFMVLSGFIFTIICLGKEIDYKSFVFNRLLRIYPLYIFFVFVAIFSGGRRVDFTSFLALATFMGNLGGVKLTKFQHIWTIMVEFQFYLIFPFIVGFFGKKGFFYALGIIGIAVLMRLFVFLMDGTVQDAAYWTILGRFDQFSMGMIIAAIYKKHKSLFSQPIWLLLSCVALVGWVFTFRKWCGGYFGEGSPNSTSTAWIIGPTVEAMVYGVVVLAYLHQKWSFPELVDKSMSYLGTISYSIYMWHFPIVGIARKFYHILPFNSFWLNFCLVVFPGIILISSLSYHIIEKPFFSLRTVYIRKQPSQ